MKRIALFICAAVLVAVGCTTTQTGGGNTSGLNADFEISVNPCYAQEPVTFTNKTKGGKQPYTCEWTISVTNAHMSGNEVSYTFPNNGSYAVTLNVTDADGNKAMRRKNVIVNPAAVPETGNLTLNWVGRTGGYCSTASVALSPSQDAAYIAVGKPANSLYSFNTTTGELNWQKLIVDTQNIAANTSSSTTPSVDADGTIYAAGGNSSSFGRLVAFNPDGTEKWRFGKTQDGGFFTNNKYEPTINGGIPAIGSENVYIGNTGTTGSVLAVNKSTGARVGYFCNTEGTGGPTGGSRAGVIITQSNTLHWYGGQYGHFVGSKATLDGAEGAGTYGGYKNIYSSGVEKSKTNAMSQMAALKINGKDCVAGIATDQTSTKIYAIDANCEQVFCHRIYDTAEQDQGGVVVDGEDNLVASLNFTLGQADGGIIVVDPTTPEGTVVRRYSVMEKVSGAPAIDAAGNVHFFTETGFYYIIKPAGESFELLLKKNLSTLIPADARYADDYEDLYVAKFWSSPIIADDGKIYCCFTDDDTRLFGGVVCISYEGCTGPAYTVWPMVGQNARHTCQQVEGL